MRQEFGIRDLMGRRGIAALTVLSLSFVLSSSDLGAQVDCPADEFSEHIDALLVEVEGPGFPDPENLDSWNHRKGDIQLKFAEILQFTSDDEARRKATIETLLAAESLAVEAKESSRLIGRTRGETRAWTRRILAGYYSFGVTPEDRKLDSGFVTELKASWDNQQAEHPQKNLPLYQEKAAALRGLATFNQLSSCDKKP